MWTKMDNGKESVVANFVQTSIVGGAISRSCSGNMLASSMPFGILFTAACYL